QIWVMTVADYATMYERPVRGTSDANCCCDPGPGRCATCPGSPGCCCQQQGSCQQTYLAAYWFCPGVDQQHSGCAAPFQDPYRWYFDDQNALDKRAHVLYSAVVDQSGSDIDRVISMSRTSYGRPGFLYIHDENCAKYDRLPPFFEQLVTAIRAP